MAHDDDEKVVALLPRPALLAELARRRPDSPEGCALAVFRHVCGVAACGHLDDGPEGLMLVVELRDARVARVGYTLDQTGKKVSRWQLHLVTGEVEPGELSAPLDLEAALRLLMSWSRVQKRD